MCVIAQMFETEQKPLADENQMWNSRKNEAPVGANPRGLRPECSAATTQILTRIVACFPPQNLSEFRCRSSLTASYTRRLHPSNESNRGCWRLPGRVAVLWNTGQGGGEVSAPERKADGCRKLPHGDLLKATRLGWVRPNPGDATYQQSPF